MRIERVRDNPEFSIIDGENQVNNLPNGLRRLFILALSELNPEIKSILISGNNSDNIVLELPMSFEIIGKSPDIIVEVIVRVAKLYRYYKSQLSQSLFQNFWGHDFIHCFICHKNYRCDIHHRCPNPDCESQQYWREIDG